MTNFMIRASLALGLTCLPFAAAAQSNLERFEELSEQLTSLTYQALVQQVPAIADRLPEVEWDRQMRRAGRCAVDAYEQEVGQAGVSAMLDELETAIDGATPSDLLTGNFNAGVPEGLTASAVQQINTDCRLTELQMERLAASGAMLALQGQ